VATARFSVAIGCVLPVWDLRRRAAKAAVSQQTCARANTPAASCVLLVACGAARWQAPKPKDVTSVLWGSEASCAMHHYLLYKLQRVQLPVSKGFSTLQTAEYCHQQRACLSVHVGMFVRERTSKTGCPNCTKLTADVARVCSSVSSRGLRYGLCISGFADGVMFRTGPVASHVHF